MKKQFGKDKYNRKQYKKLELNNFILQQISENSNFLKAIQWNARSKTNNIKNISSKVRFQNRCIMTVNKKIFHKFSKFSRTVFLKMAKLGQIYGLRKASW